MLSLLAASPLYCPTAASELALERRRRTSCAFLKLSALASHVLMALFCSARPYENVSRHGRVPSGSELMAFSATVASSSD